VWFVVSFNRSFSLSVLPVCSDNTRGAAGKAEAVAAEGKIVLGIPVFTLFALTSFHARYKLAYNNFVSYY
jgi:hypothetical protein